MLPLMCVFAGCECISVEREFLERLYMENRELMYVVARPERPHTFDWFEWCRGLRQSGLRTGHRGRLTEL